MDIITLALAANKALAKLGIKEDETFVNVIKDETLVQDTDNPTTTMITEMLEVGSTYKVETESGTFTSVCRVEHELETGTEMHVLGNVAFAGFPDTGESYGVATLLYEGYEIVAILRDYNGGNTMTVSKLQKTIVPIDPKYLPAGIGGGLPTVELETVPTAEGVALSASDVAKLEAISYALPCIVKCVLPVVPIPIAFVMQGLSVVIEDQFVYSAAASIEIMGSSMAVNIVNVNDDLMFAFEATEGS